MKTKHILLCITLLFTSSCQDFVDLIDPKEEPFKTSKHSLNDENYNPNSDNSSKTLEENKKQQMNADIINIPPIERQQLSLTPEVTFPTDDAHAININKLPLIDFCHQVFNDILKTNYVIDPAIETLDKTVTLRMKDKISSQAIYLNAADILKDNLIYIKLSHGTYYLIRHSKQVKGPVSIGVGLTPQSVPESEGTITQFIPLNYARNRDVQNMLNQLMNVYSATSKGNTVLLRGARNEILTALRIASFLDQPPAKGRYINLINFEFLNPDDFIKEVTVLLKNEGIDLSQSTEDSSVAVTPLESLNAIVIHARSKELAQRIIYWATVLDKPSNSEDKDFFTYIPKNRSAAELGEALQKLISLQMGQSVSVSASRAGSLTQNQPASQEENPLRTAATGAASAAITASNDNLALSVDEKLNAIIFYTSKKQFHSLKSGILKELDLPPKQIALEVTIAEVTITDAFDLGVEWEKIAGESIFSTLGGLGRPGGGLSYTFQSESGNFQAALNMLASKDRVKILSNPKLVVREGLEANINVGTEIPILQSEAGALDPEASQTVQSVSYRSTGVELTVTPTINSQGIVSLELSQSVSEAGENKTSSLDSPIILNRSIQTTILAADRKTVVLGGLIAENKSTTHTSIPWLGAIPLLGKLFGSEGNSTTRTELIVSLTPMILHHTKDYSALQKAFAPAYQHLDFTETIPAGEE